MDFFVTNFPVLVVLIIVNRVAYYWCSNYEKKRLEKRVSARDRSFETLSYSLSKIGLKYSKILFFFYILFGLFRTLKSLLGI
jgi:hypothetical protein